MNAALTAKILARRNIGDAAFGVVPPAMGFEDKQSGVSCCDDMSLLRYLSKRGQRKFAETFIDWLENRNLSQYLVLWRSVGGLDGVHRGVMQRVLGTEIDLQNILWMYRLKRFYGIFGDTTYGFLVPVRYRLSADVFARMANCEDAGGLRAEMSGTIYGGFGLTERELAQDVIAKYRAEGRRSYVALLCGYLYERGVHK